MGGLNKRGANAVSGGPAGKTARSPKGWMKTVLIGGALLLLAGATAWQWWSSRQKNPVPVSVAQIPAKAIAAAQAGSPPVTAPGAVSGVEIAQPIAASQPVAVVTQEVVPKQAGVKQNGHEMEAVALSTELEVPPPVDVHARPLAASRRHKHINPAPLPAPDTGSKEPEDEPDTVPVPLPEGSLNKQVKPLSVQQQAENEFRKANGLLQQGRIDEALGGYETALQLDPGNDAARQALVVLLLQNNRNADAERVLQDGLKHNIKHSGFAMLLARIQIDRDASWSALLTLQKTLPYAERQADYQAFIAALLQRLNRHKEAVMHYQAAVQLSPNSGVWWMGLGISLKALQRNEEARTAFKHALELHTLNTDLQAFVTQQMRGL